MKKTIAMLLTAAVSASLLAGCGSSSKDQTTAQASSEAASKETAGNQETSTKPSYEKETADSQPDGEMCIRDSRSCIRVCGYAADWRKEHAEL